MDREIYHNSAYHQGFIYQNPIYDHDVYAPPVSYQTDMQRAKVQKDLPLATIYVRPQVYNGINSLSDALKQGTAFVELYRPFKGGLI